MQYLGAAVDVQTLVYNQLDSLTQGHTLGGKGVHTINEALLTSSGSLFNDQPDFVNGRWDEQARDVPLPMP